MKAVVLAGGKGTRLRPITLNRPKPLVSVHNKPILDHIIEKLPKEVDQVLLACNFEKQQIIDYYSDKEMDVRVIDEPKPLGTGGAVKNLEDHIEDDFLVFNGDILSSLDIEEFIEFHRQKDGVGTLSLWRVSDPTRYGIIGTKENGKVTKFLEKPSREEVFSHWINAGMYAYTPEIFDHIPSDKKVSMEHEVFPEIIDKLYGYKFSGHWIDIGTPTSYLEAHKLLTKEKDSQEKKIPSESKVKGKVDKYSCLGKDVVIEEDAVIKESVILDKTIVKRGAVIEDSVIGSNTKIKENSEVKNASVGDNCTIEEDMELSGGLRLWNQEKLNKDLNEVF